MNASVLSTFRTYCESLIRYQRVPTREVRIGDVPMGAHHPIRLQSMTVSDTMNTLAVVEECIRMIEAGCEYIRITAPSKNEAENLLNIKKELRKRGYATPLVADIHFTPNAAEIAARIVEKVRINPGNFADKKKFETIEYTDGAYQAELERIYQRFAPLVKVCKEYGTAMRIGTNHGSLSDRIMSRYGDSPEGMVASALEFVDICEDLNYDQIVISMKSSNPLVMTEAYRLLVARLKERGRGIYPLHLGVTEAGEGSDGRIKSALGIGALLADGIGDTVRVSLTEPPEFEIPVAREIVKHYTYYGSSKIVLPEINLPFDPFQSFRRVTNIVGNIGGGQIPRVISDFQGENISESDLKAVGHIFDPVADKWNMTDTGTDYIYAGKNIIPFMLPTGVKAVYNHETWLMNGDRENAYPLFENVNAYINGIKSERMNFIGYKDVSIEDLKAIAHDPTVVIVFDLPQELGVQTYRAFVVQLMEAGITLPVILAHHVNISEHDPDNTPLALFQIHATCALSEALTDGLIDGLWLTTNSKQITKEGINKTVFNILQAARLRITKTEYISCPSCGRTLFDLQETTAHIRLRTEHLKGVKIAVMGCIVNGPGEMADADYGYVGSGVDQISLYRGKDLVEKSVKTEFAVEKLIDLIRADGKWIDPVTLMN
jgi:(E)-4-hydroxy-3-methylbut-2-enyl-diphosphate synthase